MRRRLSSAALSAALAAAFSATVALAQSTSGTGAGVFLLLPTGAQAVGMGQAFVAAESGSESVWWNPAGLAGLTKHELAIHYLNTFALTGDVLAFAVPSKSRGAFALSLNVLNPGEQQVTDDLGQPIGVILPRDVVLAGSYAKKFGGLSTGLTYKVIQFRQDCSGQCASVGTFVSSSRAADAGLQYRLSAVSPVAFGLAVRNFGGKLNAGSTSTGDALPTQTDVGFLYHVLFLDKLLKDTKVNAAASVVTTRGEGGVSLRGGTDIVYQDQVHLRAGYIDESKHHNSSATLGFGLQNGRVVFDIAREFGGLSADQGKPPTYLSLRYLF